MCGRYRLKRSEAVSIAKQLGLPLRVVMAYSTESDRWNIAPREKIPPPIIRRSPEGEAELTDAVPWGITLPDRLLINAKMESAKVHAANLTQRRCLVPAHGFYEWFALPPPGKGKVPHVLRLPENELFCFAGLWGPHSKPAPGFGPHGFVIMTGEPAPDVAWLHNRMPLVVPRDCYKSWLHEAFDTLSDLNAFISEVVLEHTWGLP